MRCVRKDDRGEPVEGATCEPSTRGPFELPNDVLVLVVDKKRGFGGGGGGGGVDFISDRCLLKAGSNEEARELQERTLPL